MTKLVFPVNVENVLLCFAEKDAETKRLQAEKDELQGDVDRLRAALRACIKSAEVDDPLKDSGWWDEQSIVAIEQARKLLGQV